jgi:predicted ATP-binding protein involved in virulence
MKINSIEIENFRCFERLTFELHPQLTVLTALNGGGKTTLLDALRIAVWPFVKGFDLGSQTGKSASIQIEDVRIKQVGKGMEPQVPAVIEAAGHWPMQNPRDVYVWSQRREKVKPRTNSLPDKNTKSLTKHAEKVQDRIRAGQLNDDGSEINLPIIVYLGTGRLWYQGRYTSEVEDTELDITAQSRLWAYQNCLTATSSYKQFEQWFGSVFKSLLEMQIAELEGKSEDPKLMGDYKNAIDVVQTAINALTEKETGWCNLQYRSSQNQQLVMEHPDHGFVPLSQLSDGLRNMVVMISDIAFRCYKLNPHLGNKAAQETEGIVLIDEVDMFLHPSWQQRVLSALREAFPCIQFVVTTHSPQVLSTIRRENIRVIQARPDGTATAEPPVARTYGEPSGDVLHSVMAVDPQPPVAEKQDLQRLTELVDQGLYDQPEARELTQRLTSALGEQHPQLQRLQRSIKRQQVLKG